MRSRYIAVDWGSTNLRAWLFDNERCQESRESEAGVTRLNGKRPQAVLDEVTQGWRDGATPVVMAGMVGSNVGWKSVPYLPLPARLSAIGEQLTPVSLDLDFDKAFATQRVGAYERLLLDAIAGRLNLFVRSDEQEQAWRWVEPILDAWAADTSGPRPYAAGSWGPAAASACSTRPASRSARCRSCPCSRRSTTCGRPPRSCGRSSRCRWCAARPASRAGCRR